MSSSGKMVLLVEDNEDNRIVYSTILKHFGYEVTEALNGEEGIAKARSEKPDLILMDISIPIIDGWEATQVLKHDPSTKGIPIIALTAHALASDRELLDEVVARTGCRRLRGSGSRQAEHERGRAGEHASNHSTTFTFRGVTGPACPSGNSPKHTRRAARPKRDPPRWPKGNECRRKSG